MGNFARCARVATALALIGAVTGCDQEPPPPAAQTPAAAQPPRAAAPADQGDRPEKIFPERGAAYKKALANAKEMGDGGFRKQECYVQFKIFQYERTRIVLRVDEMLSAHPDWAEVSRGWWDRTTRKDYLSFRGALRGFWDELVEGEDDGLMRQLSVDANAAARDLEPAMKSFHDRPSLVDIRNTWGRLQGTLKIERKFGEWPDW